MYPAKWWTLYGLGFRQITGNTLNSNKYRFPTGGDSAAKYFDGFRIYSKDESPPAIPLDEEMTFINRRIIKRPTLFASSRRNFGNLLTHYETGQDGTTPEPGPDPDPTTPISFTVSWATNGGIIQANLVGIQDGDGTEVITLTRDDGSFLATLASGSLGNHTLQHDEGTNYNTYTYTIRLDGVVQSSFTRTYEPNTPNFTTNFFSNTAKVISCGIENITNPHDSYSVRLARPDDTILDTQVLNDATPFFLQFTESDYGTYDYKLLLSKWTTTSTSNPNIPPESYWVDTVIATHQQIFVRPEPTFTTSWTKSGLTINADLSSITGAHPEFYAYLTRDDGTILATHQFQTGQTTTSLTFTETEYGSYNYQLKLGTVVKSSHTETYVRPTPTYTASFSTNELTLTAGITSITNAHNSFAITLERDDGTVLQTHTLVEGETSFTFTQTETSYATFNYVVKLNGTQTDTYSGTYTPPPTPTFDISLTNDDLAITATLTNIVNPDPYYELMIHGANDAHLAGHTFATGDTTAVLTWTETSYGEKTYTKLLNGASIGTETITLTDPNTPSTPTPVDITLISSVNWGGSFYYKYSGDDSSEHFYYDLTWINGSVYSTNHRIKYDPINKVWYDGFGQGSTGDSTRPNYLVGSTSGTTQPASANTTSLTNPAFVWGFNSTGSALFAFDNPYYEAPSTPTQPTLITSISLTGGVWNPASYIHQATDNTNTYYEYKISLDTADSQYFIAYNWTTKKWFDTNTTTTHSTFGTSVSDISSTSRETTENAAVVYVMASNALHAQFNNPYYEAPPNYNLQSFTYNGLTADENESLTQYQGSWNAWDWTWVEGDGDGVIYTFADWTLHKNTDGSFYVVKTVDGFTSGNFSPDANGIATITFNWNEHTAIMFKPP
ncbi:unnamed protein product [Bathycoccus prasinos]